MNARTARPSAVGLLALVLASLLAVSPSHAADPAGNLPASLQWLPEDAAFYGATLRLGEQIEAIGRSKAWARLVELPAVQVGWRQLRKQLDTPPDELRPVVEFFRKAEGQELAALAADLFSQEAFTYGGESFLDFVQVLTEVVGAGRYGPAFARLTGQAGDEQRKDMQFLFMLQALLENEERLRMPELLMGFRVRNTEGATRQIRRLEELLKAALADQPHKDLLGRVRVAGVEYLTFTFDGKLVPWDKVPFQEVEEKPGQAEALVKKLKAMKLVVAVGVRDGYLLTALGGSTAFLERLGQGKPLAQRPELKPLARFAERRLTSITYISEALAARTATTPEDIDGFLEVGREAVQNADILEEQKKKIRKDLDALARDLKGLLTKPGASLAFSFLTERGHDSYTYDWSEQRGLDGSKPLTLLQHVGGTPLVAVVSRSRYAPERYDLFVKWVKVAEGYVTDLLLPRLPPEVEKGYEQVMKVARPLLARWDSTTRQMLLPATADSQWAFVLDAKLTSKQWLAAAPPTEQPLPILEPALVWGISDAALLRKAFAAYRDILNDALASLHEAVPTVPELQIPPPESRKAKHGTLYFYPVPSQLGLDKRLVPMAGLSERVLALALSAEHGERLLTPTPLAVQGGPLAQVQRPLAGAVRFDWAGMLDAASPWIELGLRQAGPELVQQAADAGPEAAEAVGKDVDALLAQVRTVLAVLKVLRSYSSVTYVEDGATVTHGETVVRDL